MNTILEQYQDKINGTFSFFDRMIIKGHILQFFSPSGKKYFLSEKSILLKDFSSYANQVTKDLVRHVENFTDSLNVIRQIKRKRIRHIKSGLIQETS